MHSFYTRTLATQVHQLSAYNEIAEKAYESPACTTTKAGRSAKGERGSRDPHLQRRLCAGRAEEKQQVGHGHVRRQSDPVVELLLEAVSRNQCVPACAQFAVNPKLSAEFRRYFSTPSTRMHTFCHYFGTPCSERITRHKVPGTWQCHARQLKRGSSPSKISAARAEIFATFNDSQQHPPTRSPPLHTRRHQHTHTRTHAHTHTHTDTDTDTRTQTDTHTPHSSSPVGHDQL